MRAAVSKSVVGTICLSLLLGTACKKASDVPPGQAAAPAPKTAGASEETPAAPKSHGAAAESQPAGSKPAPQSSKAAAQPARQSLAADGTMRFSPADRCPVCAMRVDESKKFASAIRLKDGTTFHFCGTGCMLKSWLHPEVFLGQPREQLARAVTREYFGGKHIDALAAHWVAGSDVVGPMGPVLVPLANKADIETFSKRHGAKATFTMAELTDERLMQLMGKHSAAGHGGGK